MEKIEEFILGEVANDLRHKFVRCVSDRASNNNWKASILECKTTKEQNALFFSINTTSDKVEIAAEDFKESIEVMRKFFSFDLKLDSLSAEFTNIK